MKNKSLSRQELETLRSLYEATIDSNGQTGKHYELIAYMNQLEIYPSGSHEAQDKAYNLIINDGEIINFQRYIDLADKF